MSTSTQSTLLKQVGHYGGERIVGDQTVTGKFMAIHALADTAVMAGTEGFCWSHNRSWRCNCWRMDHHPPFWGCHRVLF